MLAYNERSVLNIKIEEIIKEEGLEGAKIITEDERHSSPSNTVILVGKNDMNETKTVNLFLKQIPVNTSLNENVTVAIESYRTEICVYTTILPTLLQFQEERSISRPFLSIPKCYNTCQTEKNEVLIFEDLTKKGFVTWEKERPMTDECIRIILTEYGKFHALSFAFRDQKPEEFKQLTKKITNNMFALVTKTTRDVIVTSFKEALECFDKGKEKDVYSALSKFATEGVDTVLNGFPNELWENTIILHGDSWCNNFMLQFDDMEKPTKVKFLDWQSSKVDSPAMDISHFIYANASPEVFENSKEYLKVYHDSVCYNIRELGSDPEKIFPYSSLEKYWKKFGKFGVVMACVAVKKYYTQLGMSEGQEFGKQTGLCKHPMYIERIRAALTHFVREGLV